jgi:hypothetical protein
MKAKYLIQSSSNNDNLNIAGYYTLAGASTLNEANNILYEFIEASKYSKSIYDKHFRVIKQNEWLSIIKENNLRLFNESLNNLKGV